MPLAAGALRITRVGLALAMFCALPVVAQQKKAPFQWDKECGVRGCMLMVSVLHGAAGSKFAPDAHDLRQYLSVMVMIDRKTRKPAYMAFQFPPDAEEKRGFFVGLVAGGKADLKSAPEGALNLGFDACSAKSCVARLLEGKVDDGEGGLIDFFKKLSEADHLWLMYTRKGQPVRTMIPMGAFKVVYRQILEKDLGRGSRRG